MAGQKPERQLSPMDYLAIIGGLINLAVIGAIAGHWLLS